MTKAEEKKQAEKSELVAEAIRLGVPSYEAWAMEDDDLLALIPSDDEE